MFKFEELFFSYFFEQTSEKVEEGLMGCTDFIYGFQ